MDYQEFSNKYAMSEVANSDPLECRIGRWIFKCCNSLIAPSAAEAVQCRADL